MDFKKIGLVALFVLVVASVGFFLFRLFFAAPTDEPDTEVPIDVDLGLPDTGLPTAGEAPDLPDFAGTEGEEEFGLPIAEATAVASGGPTITNELDLDLADAPVLSPSGVLAYYNKDEGKFYTIGPDGQPREMSSRVFPEVDTVTWAPTAEKAVLEFPDSSKVVFDFETQEQVTLPSHWEDFSFSNDGESFAAKSMSLDPENRWLITSDADGSNARLIEHLGNNADQVIVNVSPNSSVVALAETGDPVGFDTREVILIGQNDENFKALRVEGFNFIPQWSPNGDNLIYSASSQSGDYRPTLWFVNAKGDTIGNNRTNLGVQTWADKCTFGNETVVYCAVPDRLPVGIGLQRDLAVGIPDTIFRIDLLTGRQTTVGKTESNTSITSLVVSQDQSKLTFIDEGTGRLSQINLR